jgi:hypothetical protein
MFSNSVGLLMGYCSKMGEIGDSHEWHEAKLFPDLTPYKKDIYIACA